MVLLAVFQSEIMSVLNYPDNAQTLANLPRKLTQAEYKWQSKNISNYDIDVNAFAHLGCLVSDTTLSVRDNELLSATEHDFFGTPWPPPGKVLAIDNKETNCPLSRLLPPVMFSAVSKIQVFDPLKTLVKVEFDPEFGFVSYFNIYWYGTDGTATYTFTNFHPLTPGSP